MQEFSLDDEGSSWIDDQRFWTSISLQNNNSRETALSIDYEAHIFQNLYLQEDVLELVHGRLYNNLTDTKPVIMHGSGPGKDFLRYLQEKLMAESASDLDQLK